MPVQFSVIIPCFNSARWIEATIQSVFHQTIPQSEIEIIVVDDGSKDDSASRIQAMQAVNLRLIQITNHGASYARNVGTAASRGQFIQYLDADDLLFPDALHLRRQALIVHSADVAYGRYERLIEQENGAFETGPVVGQKMEEVSADPELAAFSSFWVPPVALMYRRAVVEKIGSWNRALPVIQDARFLQDAAYHNARFVYVPEVLGAYRVHRKGSLSKKNSDLFERDILKNIYQTENRWRKNGLLTPARIEYLSKTYKRSAEKFFGRDRARFYFAFTAHRRLRKPWEIGFPDFCAVTQACLGATAAGIILKPVWFCVRGQRFILRRLKTRTKKQSGDNFNQDAGQ
jgi:glycosyltransferase involved in cell wall biosynthesis